MRRHDFGYFFHEGVVNLFSHGFMSFAAVGITVACLLVMGTFSLVAYNVNEQLRQLESENEILAFVDDTLTEAQGRSLQSAVEAVPNVRSVRFITREEACETFEKKYEGKYALGDLDPEILRDRFAIKVIDLGRMEETREAVKKVTGIADARADEQPGWTSSRCGTWRAWCASRSSRYYWSFPCSSSPIPLSSRPSTGATRSPL